MTLDTHECRSCGTWFTTPGHHCPDCQTHDAGVYDRRGVVTQVDDNRLIEALA